MKTAFFALVLTCMFTTGLPAGENPVAGKPFTVVYDPSSTGVLSDAKEVWAVFVFDYWGTTVVQKLKGEKGEGDLFKNVLTPDEGRTTKIRMSKRNGSWTADIQIPPKASLLSYYLTDGSRQDYNNRATYVAYVRDTTGKPVRNARFRNVDFLLMAGKPLSAVLDEIRSEYEAYPDNFMAHVVYWRLRLFETTSPDTLRMLLEQADRHYAALQQKLGDTVLNYKVMNINDVNRILQLSLRDRLTDPPIADLSKTVNTTILKTIEAIPAAKRSRQIPQIEASAREQLLTPEERKEKERAAQQLFEEMLARFVGSPAPDFAFETIQGKTFRLSDFRGRYVLLDFWGSWCGPCVEEIPNLVKVYDRFEKRGLVIVSISNDAASSKWDRDKLSGYAARNGMRWHQVLDDTSTTIHKLYEIRFWPNLFLIDKDGTVLRRKGLRGEELTRTLAALLES